MANICGILGAISAGDKTRSLKCLGILYFQPMTEDRIGGSKRNANQLLNAFSESFQAEEIVVATTMWNQLSTPKHIQDANRRFICLRDKIFTPSSRMGITATKFELSKSSALLALEERFSTWYHSQDDLLNRITNAQQLHILVVKDKRNATKPGREDRCLLEVLADKKGVLTTLKPRF
ncbi:hypothetical protein BJ165DRAFT_1534100 [Panaeolus papilionaceus]|nr:hypothetical protein BJ165DRAFT_1534100 [Panaeolus papilionaceus]